MSEKKLMRFPLKEERDMVETQIKSVFGQEGIALESITLKPDGRMLAKADIPATKQDSVASGLFCKGIVIVRAGSGEWGIAVRN